MKRKPTIIPHLAKSNSSGEQEFNARKKGLTPSQTTLSVQNIPDVTSPKGTAMVNEEFRRLRAGVEALKAAAAGSGGDNTTNANPLKPNAGGGTTGGGGTNGSDGKDGEDGGTTIINQKWALTLFKNNIAVDDPMVVQGIKFMDSFITDYPELTGKWAMPIVFTLMKRELEQEFKTIDEAVKIEVVAKAIVTHLDWAMYHPFGEMSVKTRTLDDVIGYGYFKEWRRKAFSLVNDQWEPGPMKYYGTNSMEQKGFHPVGEMAASVWKSTASHIQYNIVSGSVGKSLVITKNMQGLSFYSQIPGSPTTPNHRIPVVFSLSAHDLVDYYDSFTSNPEDLETLDAKTLEVSATAEITPTQLTNVMTRGKMSIVNELQPAVTEGPFQGRNQIQVKLAGDVEAPGQNMYYGTNQSGTKGFHALPTGSGGTGDLTYTHTQSSPSIQWLFSNPLGKRVNVQCYDDNSQVMYPDIEMLNGGSEVRCTFKFARTGTVVLS